jgi:ABC-2 type transport system permease protein
MALTLPNVESLLSNPVVVRDLRMRLRGSRAFWSQAFYLGLLIVIALGGYLTAAGSNGRQATDPVEIQRNLQMFYYFIFETLAGLITLIAPALTAVAIISERQRLTLDLLVASPMTAMKMLSGKLISSIAFLMLLLVMSIPASALCVILGGATVADVLRIYALLAIDGIVLAAIGLAFSCTSKQNVQAIISTYGAIALLYCVCAPLASMAAGTMYGAGMVAGIPAVPGITTFAMLCPFMAVATPNVSVNVGSVPIPLWITTIVVGLLFVRILLTAAALRLGMYGQGLVGSLRRQLLLAVALILYLVGSAIAQEMPTMIATECFVGIVITTSIAFLVGLFFFPTLFVPVVDEDAPAGQLVRGQYIVRSMFKGDHSGSLPFYHLLLIVGIAAVSIGIALPQTSTGAFGMPAHLGASATAMSPIHASLIAAGCSLWYLSGLGFLIWSLARRCASFVGTVAAARPVTFLLFAFLAAAPLAVILITEQISAISIPLDQMWITHVWLFYPPSTLGADLTTINWKAFVQTGILAYVLGVIVFPFWKPVKPAYGMRELRRAATPAAQGTT